MKGGMSRREKVKATSEKTEKNSMKIVIWFLSLKKPEVPMLRKRKY